MDRSIEALSEIVIFNKYAKYNAKEGRRETWDEIVDRYTELLLKKYGTENDQLLWNYKDVKEVQPAAFYSDLGREIIFNSQYLREKKVLMSMRMAQFAGQAVEKNHTRGYNCAYLPIEHPAAFSETMFLLLGGTGVGYSVQNTHIDKLPEISKGTKDAKFLIGDSIEGWADAIKAIMYWAFGKRKHKPRFDFSDIRAKGERLVTAGGKAPGPAPLRICLAKIEGILENKENGSKLTSLEVHDILCHIADAVLAGGIRRAAMIALFSADDMDMITCKSGNWWEKNPQRGRANNSAVLLRHRVTKEFFLDLWKRIEDSNAGEPGIYFSNDANWGTNPCCEIALRPYQFCNLTEINAGSVKEAVNSFIRQETLVMSLDDDYKYLLQNELDNRAKAAAFFGTLQAGFTDFHYLRPIWRQTTEKDALVGVGITGICNGDILDLDLTEAANVAIEENKRVSAIIGINSAARVTTIKPSGTTSCVLGTSSGIHAWHSKYYIRNMQCAVGDDLFNYFQTNHPELITIMEYDSKSAVIGIPQKAPDGAILRENENAVEMLDRIFKFYDNWVKVGHQSGANTNNVSATVSIKKDYKTKKNLLGFDEHVLNDKGELITTKNEWPEVGEILWNNRHKFNGMSVLPFDNGSYKNAPFEVCTEAEFNEKYKYLADIDLTKISEAQDNTTQSSELACAGDNCVVY
jgi:ribonucleoside-triphosphate reductase